MVSAKLVVLYWRKKFEGPMFEVVDIPGSLSDERALHVAVALV